MKKNQLCVLLKVFIIILTVMCFSACVVVNYFDFKQVNPPGKNIFEFEFGKEDHTDV